MERRKFLKMAGAATLAGGVVWYGAYEGRFPDQRGTAYSAWNHWEGSGEPGPLKAVRAAVLAASPHNTQPWRFRVSAGFIEIYLETSRSVRGLDPYRREAHIGVGCAVENLLLSAAANGYAARLTLAEGELGGGPERPALRLK